MLDFLFKVCFLSYYCCRNIKHVLLFLLWSFPELPIKFLQELKNIQVQEGNGVTLTCELSKPGVTVQWKKGDDVITNGEKYQMKQSGCTVELLIRKSLPEDSGTYSCVCDGIKSTATIIITGQPSAHHIKEKKDDYALIICTFYSHI